MRLSTYIQRTRALGDAKVPAPIIDQIAERIAGGAELSVLLKKRTPLLTPRILLGIWRAHRRHSRHMGALRTFAQKRREAGSPITSSLLKQTVAEHELTVLARAEDLAPAGRVAEHRRRDAIKEAISLWRTCLSITRRFATLTLTAADPDSEWAQYARVTTLAEIAHIDWWAIRKGLKAEALTLTLEFPQERLIAQLSTQGAELSALTSGHTAAEFLNLLVMVDLEDWALRLKDDEATVLSTRDACNAWFATLTTTRPKQTLYGAVWLSEDAMGVAILSREGRLLAHADAEGTTVQTLESLLANHPVDALIFADTQDTETLREGFSSLVVLEGPTVAVDAGVEAQTETAEPLAERALLMARRVVRPLKFWGQVDPVLVPLMAGQDALDIEDLRKALNDMRALALAGLKPVDIQRKVATKPKPVKVLNPMLKSVDDLRPGLMIDGIVTNITQFGAFVNIGLSHEGLVHVSEMADHFVSDPKELVSIEQDVKVRVLGVDRGRRRISLSMRAEGGARPDARTGEPGSRVRLDDIPGQRGGRRGRGIGMGERRGPAATGASRSQALADLEALFKKK